MTAAWRPTDEAEAASDLSLYVEWLRATGLQPDARPTTLAVAAFGPWLDLYVSDGDPARAAAIRIAIRRARPAPDAPRTGPPSPA